MIRLLRAALCLAVSAVALVGCATPKDLTRFREANIRSVLIVPVVNNSVDVRASDYLLTSLPKPVAESGYYVFPVHLVKRVLEDDGLSDTSLIHQAAPERVASLFGADAVLYVTIEKWTAKYFVLSASVEVDLRYVLKSGKTGETLWEERRQKSYVPPNTNTGNVFGDLIAAAITAAAIKAAPNYMPIARLANEDAFAYPGPGLLRGPYWSKDKSTRVPTSTAK